MTIETEVKSLRKLHMFSNLDLPKLKLVAMISDRVAFRAGEAIFRRGESPDAAYIVLEGSVRIAVENATVDSVFEKSGVMLLGEVGILCGRPRSVTVEATTPVAALRIEAADFMRMIRETPDFAFAIMHQLAEQLDAGTQAVARRLAQAAL